MGSELPDRGLARWAVEGVDMWDKQYGPVAKQVIEAYANKDLKSRDEMDEEAARVVLETGGEGLAPASWAMWTERILDAAWGVTE